MLTSLRVATRAILLGAVAKANEAGDKVPAAATTTSKVASSAGIMTTDSVATDLLKLGAVAGLNTCNAWQYNDDLAGPSAYRGNVYTLLNRLEDDQMHMFRLIFGKSVKYVYQDPYQPSSESLEAAGGSFSTQH